MSPDSVIASSCRSGNGRQLGMSACPGRTRRVRAAIATSPLKSGSTSEGRPALPSARSG
jgi:hypothetical protein